MKLIGLSVALAGVLISVAAAQGWGPNGWWKERAMREVIIFCTPIFMAGVGWEIAKLKLTASRRIRCQAKESVGESVDSASEAVPEAESVKPLPANLQGSAKPVRPA